MNPRVVTAAIELIINELFEDLSAGQLAPSVQKQIRERLAETFSKGVVASIIALKGSQYVAEIGKHCSDGSELIERLVARDAEISDHALSVIPRIREDILREISDRLAAAVESGVA